MDVQPASPSKKQGEEQKDLVRQDSKPGKFRIIAQLVKAAKRFEASLNPTYEFGKKQQEGSLDTSAASRVMVQPKNAQKTHSSTRSGSGRTISGKPSAPGQTHGHKGSLLFKPLADVRS